MESDAQHLRNGTQSTVARRRIRSFVRREGRLTPAQRRALERLWGDFGLSACRLAELDTVFGRRAPRWLEIGCGTGETLCAAAEAHPENDYLGIEVYRPGLGRLLQALDARRLTNVRIVCDDAVPCLQEWLPDESVEGILLFFPDPWPKKRHHKRRLVQPQLVALLRRKLACHGRLFIATDWQDYAEHVIAVMGTDPGFVNLAGPSVYAPRPAWRPLTRYERRAIGLQHTVRDFAFARVLSGTCERPGEPASV